MRHPGDLPALEPLRRAFEEETPEPPWVDADIEDELHDLAERNPAEATLSSRSGTPPTTRAANDQAP